MTSHKRPNKFPQRKSLQHNLINPYSIVALSLIWIIIWSLGISLGQWLSGLDAFIRVHDSSDANSIISWVAAIPFIIGGFGLGYANTILRKDKNILTSTITGGIVCSAIAYGTFITLGMIVHAIQR